MRRARRRLDAEHVVNTPSVVEDHLRVEVLEGIPHHEVRVVSRSHRPGPAQAVAARGLDRCHLDRGDRADPHADRLAHVVVNIPFPDDIVNMAVVGAEAEPFGIRVVLHNALHNRFKVPGGAAFADQAEHPRGTLAHNVFIACAFMVCRDTRQHIGCQVFLGKPGRVPVLDLAVKQFDLGVHFRIAGDHGLRIHHFPESQHPAVSNIGLHFPRGKTESVVVNRGCRNAGGDHHVDVRRRMFRLVKDIIDSVPPGYVRRLMRVDDERRRSVHGCLGDQHLRIDHRGLQVEMRVDKAAGYVLPVNVDFFLALVIPDPHDHAVLDRDVSLLYPVGENIDNTGVFQNQVSRYQFSGRL